VEERTVAKKSVVWVLLLQVLAKALWVGLALTGCARRV